MSVYNIYDIIFLRMASHLARLALLLNSKWLCSFFSLRKSTTTVLYSVFTESTNKEDCCCCCSFYSFRRFGGEQALNNLRAKPPSWIRKRAEGWGEKTGQGYSRGAAVTSQVVRM